MKPFAVLLLLALIGCASADPGPPPVDVAELAPVVADLQLAESIALEVPALLQDSMRREYYATVLKEHGYTTEEFNNIMWEVRREPQWIDSLYTRVSDIIATKNTKFGGDVK